jgi:hypothetical protein
VSVFPNPVSTTVYLRSAVYLNNAACRVTDITGKTVHEKYNINGFSFSIDVSTQTQGLYILELADEKGIARLKLLKN